MKHFLGALLPKIDTRDYRIAAAAQEYPQAYMCEDLPPVKNQKNVGSCVAHATSTILEWFNQQETGMHETLSTHFIYGMQGVAYGRKDSGMYLRDACKIVKEYGDAPEELVPGNIEQPEATEALSTRLNDAIYEAAKSYKVKTYAKCKTAEEMKYALMNYGPLLGAIKWYDDYDLDIDRIKFDKNSDYGYHAIMIVGWNSEGWVCRNSWGRNWGKAGLFVYPFKEKFTEVWSFVDEEGVKKPVNNKWLNYIYKLINYICNLFKRNA